jgi:hypothetical protein
VVFYSAKSPAVGMRNPDPRSAHARGGGQDAKVAGRRRRGLVDDQENSKQCCRKLSRIILRILAGPLRSFYAPLNPPLELQVPFLSNPAIRRRKLAFPHGGPRLDIRSISHCSGVPIECDCKSKLSAEHHV